MVDTATRPFCVVARWPDKAPVMLGTFTARADVKDHERDEIAAEAVREFIGRHLPDGTALPAVERIMSGEIVFWGRE